MTSQSPPEELVAARAEIDTIDRELVALLGKRFELTHQVGLLKASKALDALDASRESQKLAELSSLCKQHNLNPVLVTELFSKIMEEVVKNHRQLRSQA
ncbi:MAG: chorismate mutase [Pseudohongiellaceae bacterium]